MTSTKQKLFIRNLNLDPSPTSSAPLYNIDTAKCQNKEATSAETKCSLPSSLVNMKTIKNIVLDKASSDSAIFSSTSSTAITISLDTDYAVPADKLPNNKGRMVHLEGLVKLLYSSGALADFNMETANIPNGNKVEALIPGHSCFNLMVKESITEVTIPFTATSSLFDEENNALIQSDVTLQGQLITNVIEAEYNEVLPCTP
jgi:hypothetical protein